MATTSDEVRTGLKEFISAQIIGNAAYEISYDEPLITGGLIDSFALAQIGVFVDEAFGVYIPDSDLTVEKMNTLRQIVDRIMQGMS